MAYPVVEATNVTEIGTATTSHAVNLPSSIAAGDLLLVFFSSKGTGTATFPDGWTEVYNVSFGSRYVCFKRIATGSEGATVTVTTGSSVRSASNSYRISGHQQGQVESVTATNTLDPSSLTASWGVNTNLFMTALHTAVTNTSIAAPTNFGNLLYAFSGGTSLQAVTTNSARREVTGATQNPGAWSVSGSAENLMSVTLVIRPLTPTLDAALGQFTLTGIDATLKRVVSIAANTGTFILTGYSVLLSKVWRIICSTGEFILTGFATTLEKGRFGWRGTTKDSTTWANTDRAETNWSNQNKEDSDWTNQSKQ
jgi:hypothetical protein